MFFGYFYPENNFSDNKINDFQGDLADISAKKEALETSALFKQPAYWRGHLNTIDSDYIK